MPVPDFQSIMYPFLYTIRDGNTYSLDQMVERLAEYFQLTPEDLREQIPSGKQPLFRNRVGWARTYLDKAGLIEKPARALYKITDLGKEALGQALDSYINISFLKRFPKYIEWEKSFNNGGGRNSYVSTEIETPTSLETPDDIIDHQIQSIHRNLELELLEILKDKPADFFEFFVTQLLSKMGYGGVDADNFEVVGRSSDGGIDGIVYQDHLQLEKVFIQAKRWRDTKVNVKEVRDFIGALSLQGTTKGVFMTTSDFTQEAIDASLRNPQYKIVLINGKKLTELAVQFNVGIQTQKTIEIKNIDLDFFEN